MNQNVSSPGQHQRSSSSETSVSADRVFFTNCPSCRSSHIVSSLTAEDFTVSHQLFEIWHCGNCSLRFTQNIPDQSAIGRYYQSEDYISHSDTNRGVVNRLYRTVRNLTLRQKRRLVESVTHLSAGHLLDLGAGTGGFASVMKNAGWQVSALEPDEQARKKAAELYSVHIDDSSTFFDLGQKTFDAITMWHVIEHVHSLHEYLSHLGKLLKPGGSMLIAVPNYTSFDAEFYKHFWAAYDVPRHLYHFSPASMRILLKQHGFVLKSIRPMWFDSFYVSLLSEKYETGRSNLIKGFWNGAVSNMKALINTERASSLIYVIQLGQ